MFTFPYDRWLLEWPGARSRPEIPPRWVKLKEMLVSAGFEASFTKATNEWDGNDNSFKAVQLNVKMSETARAILQRLRVDKD